MLNIVHKSNICMMSFKEAPVGSFFITKEPGKECNLYIKTKDVMNPILKDSVQFNCIKLCNRASGLADEDTVVTVVYPEIIY